MATKELQEVRHEYKAGYTANMSCVRALSDAGQAGQWPARDVLGGRSRKKDGTGQDSGSIARQQ